MPTKMKINQSTNNSSALIAPNRSEIRIELPSVSIPSWKSVFKTACSIYLGIAHKVSLCSVVALSSICTLELNVSLAAMITLSVVTFLSSTVSFYLIYSEVAKEEDSTWEN